jgi:hypothetical protein
VKGIVLPEPVLYRARYALPFIRRVDPFGYIRLSHWRLYGGLGLAGKAIAVWFFAATLRLAYESVLLARYG